MIRKTDKLVEATMLALQGKLELKENRVKSKRAKRTEGIDVNVDDSTTVSVEGNETIVDTNNATVIVNKKENEFVPETSDDIPMEAPIEEPEVEAPVAPDEDIVEVPADDTIMPEEITDEPVNTELPEDEEPSIDEMIGESKDTNNAEVKTINVKGLSNAWKIVKYKNKYYQLSNSEYNKFINDPDKFLNTYMIDGYRTLNNLMNSAKNDAVLGPLSFKENKKVESVEIEVSDDGKEVEVTTDNGEEVEVKDETPDEKDDDKKDTETELPEDDEEEPSIDEMIDESKKIENKKITEDITNDDKSHFIDFGEWEHFFDCVNIYTIERLYKELGIMTQEELDEEFSWEKLAEDYDNEVVAVYQLNGKRYLVYEDKGYLELPDGDVKTDLDFVNKLQDTTSEYTINEFDEKNKEYKEESKGGRTFKTKYTPNRDKKVTEGARDIANHINRDEWFDNDKEKKTLRGMLADKIADVAEGLGEDYSEWISDIDFDDIINDIINSKEWEVFDEKLNEIIAEAVEDKVDWTRRDEPASRYYTGNPDLEEGKKVEDTEEYLQPRFDSRASFYKKAKVVTKDNGDEELYSYGTHVGGVRGGKPYSKGRFSQTTSRHQREFFKQRGLDPKKVDVEEGKQADKNEKEINKKMSKCINCENKQRSAKIEAMKKRRIEARRKKALENLKNNIANRKKLKENEEKCTNDLCINTEIPKKEEPVPSTKEASLKVESKYSSKSFNEVLTKYYKDKIIAVESVNVTRIAKTRTGLKLEANLIGKSGKLKRAICLEMKQIQTGKSFDKYEIVETKGLVKENKENNKKVTMTTFRNRNNIIECRYILSK